MPVALPLDTAGGNTFTTLAQEASFLAALDADTARVTVHQFGTSVEGNPLRAVVVGTPTAPALGPTPGHVMVVGGQHGDEPAGREAALALAHHYAYTNDTVDLAWLAAHPLIVVPTLNPDGSGMASGSPGGQRANANGVDINRTHLSLSQPETQALADLLSTVGPPSILFDLHENFEASNMIEVGFTPQPNVPIAVRELHTTLGNDVIAALAAQGLTSGSYTGPGDGHYEQLTNTARWRTALGVVLETKSINGSPTLAARRGWHLAGFHAVRAWYAARPTIAADIGAAFDQLAQEAHESFVLWKASGVTDGLAAKLSPPPGAYLLTGTQRSAALGRMTTFGITATADGSLWRVPTNTRQRIATHYLLDPQSTARAVDDALTVPPPDPDPGGGTNPDPGAGSGLFRTDGAGVTLSRTNGAPVTLTD